jgi:hypothetical protein
MHLGMASKLDPALGFHHLCGWFIIYIPLREDTFFFSSEGSN